MMPQTPALCTMSVHETGKKWRSKFQATYNIPKLRDRQMVIFSFFFMFKSHRATHGNSASTKSNAADQAVSLLNSILKRG